MEKQFLVKFRVCEQVGQDDWKMISKERLFSDDHKLSDVKEWVLNNSGFKRHENGYKRMLEVYLSEPE